MNGEAKIIEELKQELALNAKMLARQTDMAREAENKVAELLGACKLFNGLCLQIFGYIENGTDWSLRMTQFISDLGKIRAILLKAEGRE